MQAPSHRDSVFPPRESPRSAPRTASGTVCCELHACASGIAQSSGIAQGRCVCARGEIREGGYVDEAMCKICVMCACVATAYKSINIGYESVMQYTGVLDDVFDSHELNQGIILDTQNPCDPGDRRAYPQLVSDHLTTASSRFAHQIDASAINEQSQLMGSGFDTTAELNSLFYQSTRLLATKNKQTVFETLLSFSRKSNCGTTDIVGCLKRSIIASMKLIDTEAICSALQDELPTDLRCFEDIPDNVYGDFTEWSKLLQSLKWDDVVEEYLFGPESHFCNKFPTIKFVCDTLRQIGANTLCVTDMLKIYLMTNIRNINCRIVVTSFFEDRLPSTFNCTAAVYVFTCAMADSVRFGPTQFTHDLSWLLLNINVDDAFKHEFEFFVKRTEAFLVNSKTENLKHRPGRLRLRDRVGMRHASSTLTTTPPNSTGPCTGTDMHGDFAERSGITGSRSASLLSQIEQDSLQGWAMRARVPPAFSHKHKLLGYVLMSQTAFADPSEALRKHFASDKEVYTNMLAQRVCKPHASSIIEFLRLLNVQVTAFDELLAFRSECFSDFSYTDSKNLTWLKFLQLYIAIYQHEGVWTSVWTSFCPVLSHQVLLSVGNFKKKSKYALDKVVDICMGTTPVNT
jgi:hypothetical protein